MKTYTVKALDSDGRVESEGYDFELQDLDTVLALKIALEKRFIYTKEQVRIFFRKENGCDIGLDDEDVLEDIAKDPGQFLVQCPPLGPLYGQISIQKHFDEEVNILIGTTKDFEHFKILRYGDNLKLPKAKLNFVWAHNKLAIVANETDEDYLADQYLVENGWSLMICKNENGNPDDPENQTWTLKRLEPSGETTTLA